ncbi:MAG: hypothetical protein HYX37_16140 [Rhizobiales bacterium]|nr:hypothetical protein [Hyphomicrobiales bacterium]
MAKSPMSAKIAVLGTRYPSSLKQTVLLFDRIAVPKLDGVIQDGRRKDKKYVDDADYHLNLSNDLEYLASKEIAFDPGTLDGVVKKMVGVSSPREEMVEWATLLVAQESAMKAFDDLRKILPEILKSSLDAHEKEFEKIITKYVENAVSLEQFNARLLAKKMQRFDGLNASPVIEGELLIPEGIRHEYIGKIPESIVQVVIGKLPMPSDLTPWEQIFDFKSDVDAQGYLAGLRTWMNDVTRQQLTAKEAEQKLEWLMFQHEKHLKVHGINFRLGALGAIFVASAEMIEDLVKIRWGKSAKGLVEIANRHAKLLEAELKSPAKEISYILRTQKRFGI